MNRLAVRFYDLHPPETDMYVEVLEGLMGMPRSLPPKYFYDRQGSELFEAITRTAEYYPTRTEVSLLERYGDEMAALIGQDGLLVELGSGSSRKIRLLLDALRPSVYMPVDISRDFLRDAARSLAREFPRIQVHAICADYSHALALLPCPKGMQVAAFFPGSSIGNFEPAQARQLLQHVAQAVGPGGHLIIGVDLQKDLAILDRAYNDSEGLTAAFNRNLLSRINRELGADFNPEAFSHHAFYNAAAGRVEMHLISCNRQTVHIGQEHIEFYRGDGIHTENSYKYTIDGFQRLAEEAGFTPTQVWTDEDRLFSVHCLQVR